MHKTVTGADYLQEHLEKMSTLMREARGDLTGWRYASVEELVLTEGKLLDNEPFTEDEEAALTRLFKAAPGPYCTKQCYLNAMRLMFEDPTLTYHEGYASGHIFPVPHAWVTLNSKPVDVTWGEDMTSTGHNRARSPQRLLERVCYNNAHSRYWGIQFPRDEVLEQVLDTGLSPTMITTDTIRTGIEEEVPING